MTNSIEAVVLGNAPSFDSEHQSGIQTMNGRISSVPTAYQTKLQRRRSDLTVKCNPAMQVETEGDSLERIVMHAFRLSPIFRKVFLLCDIQKFTVAEAAAILDISPAAVIARLHRARREMNARLSLES